jgi:hypothetical protein
MALLLSLLIEQDILQSFYGDFLLKIKINGYFLTVTVTTLAGVGRLAPLSLKVEEIIESIDYFIILFDALISA